MAGKIEPRMKTDFHGCGVSYQSEQRDSHAGVTLIAVAEAGAVPGGRGGLYAVYLALSPAVAS
jgi:hypothetical protein